MAESNQGPPTSLRDTLTFRINRTGRQLDRFSERYGQQLFGMKLAELRFIGGIGYETDVKFARVCELASLEKGQASRLLVGLVENGLVDRRDGERDARSTFLRLTADGLALFERMRAADQALDTCLTGVLTPEQAQTFKAGLTVVHDRLVALNVADNAVAAVASYGGGTVSDPASGVSTASPPSGDPEPGEGRDLLRGESLIAPSAMQLAYLLRMTGKRMFGRVAALTVNEFPILTMLIRQGDQTIGDICARLDRDKAHVSKDVAALVARGLVTKDRAVGDARQVVVRIAPGAAAEKAALFEIMQERSRRLTEGLTAAEIATLERLLNVVVRNAQDMRRD